MVQHRRLMAPRVDGAQLDGAAVNVLIKEGELLTIGQAQVYPCAVRLAVQLDDGGQKAGGVALGQLRLGAVDGFARQLGMQRDRVAPATLDLRVCQPALGKCHGKTSCVCCGLKMKL